MANSAAGEASDYNAEIIKEFRANHGRVGGMWAGTTLILIHHIGANSGIERITPVACSPQGGGRFAIWAANGGSPTHPNWYYNLKAHPRITVEVGTQTFTVLTQELDNTARAELWPKLVGEWPKPMSPLTTRRSSRCAAGFTPQMPTPPPLAPPAEPTRCQAGN
jgi:deazaflavin-dependent oxidoreductase (nitroreductase family)